MKKAGMKRLMLLILLGAVIAAFGLMAYALLWEPYWLKVEQNVLEYNDKERIPTGLRIVQLSDIHRSDIVPDSYIKKCISRVNELEPDIIFLTGDYITGKQKWADELSELLSPLRAPMGVWASLGNHDGGRWAARYGGPTGYNRVREELEKAGIGVLVNEHVRLDYNGTPITVVGLGDLWAGFFDPQQAFKGIKANDFVICLSHNPDTLRMLQGHPVDLFFCGHTHGGQVFLPLVGAPILPIEDVQYGAGLYRMGRGFAYVSRGIGLLRQVRFNCRPEISLFEVM